MSQTLNQMLLLIDGVINAPAEVVAMDRAIAAGSASEASLMLADFAIPYPTADEAQVAMLEDAVLFVNGADLTPKIAATLGWELSPERLEQLGDQRARDWLASLPAAQG